LGQLTIYYLALGVAFLSLVLVRGLSSSAFGMAMRSIKDNETAAERCGVDTFKVKFEAFCISALVTGWAGGIYYLGQGYIEPLSAFGIQWLIAIMLSVIIGGRGTVGGPISGVALFLFLYFLLARYGEISLILHGGLVITIAILAPQGLVGIGKRIKVLLQRS
jgi:branched-chain amino acid transport system permease protein